MSVLPRRSHYSFENVNIVIFPIIAVCLNIYKKKKNLLLILQPGLSRTETALVLLMIIPLPLHAVSRVRPWPLAAHHALSAAECFQIRYNHPLQSI